MSQPIGVGPSGPMSAEPVAAPAEAVRPADSARPATFINRIAFTLIAVALAGLVAVALGWIWVRLANPPSVPMGDRGISYGEAELNALAATPGWFVVIGFVSGFLIGAVITVLGRRLGWFVVIAVLASTVTAAVVTRYSGTHWFSPDVQAQLHRASRGDPIQLDVRLGARALLLIWPAAGLAAVVAVVAVAWPRRGDPTAGGHSSNSSVGTAVPSSAHATDPGMWRPLRVATPDETSGSTGSDLT